MAGQRDREAPVGAAMVVGGGIAGMQAALDLAESDIKVYLLERSPWIGGRMAQLDKTFPTNDCAMCIISPKLVETSRHHNIEIISNADLVGLDGDVGDFTATVRRRARYVDVTRCTGCGDCEARCPVSLPSRHNVGLNRQKAIFRAYPQAIPQAFAMARLGVSPCKAACPAEQSAQGYVALIRERRYADALRVILDRVPFPSICGRICNRPCEAACNRGDLDEPVAIAALKGFVGDWAARNGAFAVPRPARTREQTIAVVGSGPAGLTAARDLVQKGYGVTVFEALPVAGGMLRVGIPEYRLPTEVIEREVQAIVDMGVDLRLSAPVADLDALFADGYGAVLVAVGAHRGRTLPLPGADADGVLEGTAFLRSVRLGAPPKIGARVLVLGGGDVAFDVARTALRLGAGDVSMAFVERRDAMRASPRELRAGLDEGVSLLPSRSFTRIVAEHGRVAGVECVEVRSFRFSPDGRLQIETAPQSEHVVECDTVIFAIGQAVDAGPLAGDTGVGLTPHGTVAADGLTQATGRPGVFAAGDAVSGTSFVVEAIAAGHRAAESIHRYLTGQQVDAAYAPPAHVVTKTREEMQAQVERGEAVSRPRAVQAERSALRLLDDFGEVDLPLSEEAALAEAQRCLDCAICSDCGECEIACLPGAVRRGDGDREEAIRVGAVVLAAGAEVYDATLSGEFGFGRFPNVVTNLQFERLLSAAGPTQGHLRRPSDGGEPRRIAWLQCVGSRDQERPYCSSYCCMAATKEAMLAKEHLAPGAELSIFLMDMRAFGKGFDAYFRRAEQEGVRYVRCRASALKEAPGSGNLLVQHEDATGEMVTGEYDMVVLSVGLTAPRGAGEIASAAGVALGDFAFASVSAASPLETSRPGVFACGAFRGPKDIPDSVTEASAAAAEVQRLLAGARGDLARPREYPPERSVDGEEPRVGVFVCHCGTNIAGVVDVKDVREWAKGLPHVVHADDLMFACSTDSLKTIRDTVAKHRLNRIVVASCTPRTHEPLFQDNARDAGLNPYLFEMANIRDQCSWVHRDAPARATAKSKALVAMATSRAAHLSALHKSPQGLSHRALVVGGGVAGMTAALTLADQGVETVLVEREPELGGMLRRGGVLTSGLDAAEVMDGIAHRVAAHENIEVLTDSQVVKTIGFLGNFKSTVASRRDPTQRLVEHAITVIATGGREHRGDAYHLGRHPSVMTMGDFEAALTGADPRLKAARRIVVVQCVGPWDDQPFYCSRVCCSVTMKNVRRVKELNPDCQVVVLSKDVRTYGVQEQAYTEARRLGAIFVRYSDDTPPTVEPDGDGLQVSFTEPSLREEMTVAADLLVLSTALVPSEGAEGLGMVFKVPRTREGFFQEAHSKLRPVDFASDGAFLCGVAHYPKSVEEAIIQGKAAAARAARVLSQKELQVGGVVATVDPRKCTACLTCVRICPYTVPVIDATGVAFIAAASCQGCGICAAECPAKAIQLDHYRDDQVVARVEGLALVGAGRGSA